MKGNMFCASTAICKSMDHSHKPTIDRHNPIIKEARRSFTAPCSSADDYIAPYLPLQITKIPSSSSTKIQLDKPRRSTSSSLLKLTTNVSLARKSFSCAARPACDFTKTTNSSVSTRYLLGSEPGQDKVIPAGEPSESRRGSHVLMEKKSSGLEQVVVLRVSLHCHCKGCESKVKKHLSRMQGVTSFNIDFASKKVTVTGDITPLEVLGCLSKVKNAQFWTPIPPSSNPKLNLQN